MFIVNVRKIEFRFIIPVMSKGGMVLSYKKSEGSQWRGWILKRKAMSNSIKRLIELTKQADASACFVSSIINPSVMCYEGLEVQA